jgi:Janus/Ocnus family (Ocnus)
VAQDLKEWIKAAGYTPVVKGGGHIEYLPSQATASIYGTSYGFGKADHRFASSILSSWNPLLRISLDDPLGYLN